MTGSGKNRRGSGEVPDGQLSLDALLWGPAAGDTPEQPVASMRPAEEGERDEPVRAAGPAALGHVGPNQLSQIPDPDAFFTDLGEQVAIQVDQVAAELAGDDPGGEDYLEKLGRLQMARFNAEAQVLRELVLLPPEPGHPQAEQTEELPPGVVGVTEWLPMVLTPDHPNYHDLDDDPFLHRITPEEQADPGR